MKYYQETITGDLIIIKTTVETPPPCPVIARSAKPAAPLWPALLLWIIAIVAAVGASVPRPTPGMMAARLTVLAIVGLAIVEVVAQGYVEQSLGVLT